MYAAKLKKETLKYTPSYASLYMYMYMYMYMYISINMYTTHMCGSTAEKELETCAIQRHPICLYTCILWGGYDE